MAIAMMATGAALAGAGPWIVSLLVAIVIALVPMDTETWKLLERSIATDWIARGLGVLLILAGVVLWFVEHARERKRQEAERKREADALAASYVLKVEPEREGNWLLFSEPGPNGIRFGDTKYQQNGRFDLELVLNLVAGASTISITKVELTYYSQGCPCLHGALALFRYQRGGSKSALGTLPPELCEVSMSSDNSLVPELSLPAHEGARVMLHRRLGTVLPSDVPFDCDAGDIALAIHYRSRADRLDRVVHRKYRLTKQGELVDIDRIGDVPRLSDIRVQTAHDRGIINDEELGWLTQHDAIDRFLALRSETDADNLSIDRSRLRELNSKIENGFIERAHPNDE